jgi:hypothetical protein
MVALEQASILAVGVDDAQLTPSTHSLVDVTSVDSATKALELMRLLRFDLLLVGLRVDRPPPWDFVRRMRARWPDQKWLLAANDASEISPVNEIVARSLGATCIASENELTGNWLVEIATRCRDQHGSRNRLKVVALARGTRGNLTRGWEQHA